MFGFRLKDLKQGAFDRRDENDQTNNEMRHRISDQSRFGDANQMQMHQEMSRKLKVFFSIKFNSVTLRPAIFIVVFDVYLDSC